MSALPIVRLRSRRWFYDQRLRELRQVHNPHKIIGFDYLSDAELVSIGNQLNIQSLNHGR